VISAASCGVAGFDLRMSMLRPEFVAPFFPLKAIIGIALPLFIVTMVSLNLPGMSFLGVYGFRPDSGRLV
jgi:benzoate membrane transport protein